MTYYQPMAMSSTVSQSPVSSVGRLSGQSEPTSEWRNEVTRVDELELRIRILEQDLMHWQAKYFDLEQIFYDTLDRFQPPSDARLPNT